MAKAMIHVIRHPVVQHKLTLMREKGTSVTEFRALASEAAMLMAYEVTRDFPMEKKTITTPLGRKIGRAHV